MQQRPEEAGSHGLCRIPNCADADDVSTAAHDDGLTLAQNQGRGGVVQGACEPLRKEVEGEEEGGWRAPAD